MKSCSNANSAKGLYHKVHKRA